MNETLQNQKTPAEALAAAIEISGSQASLAKIAGCSQAAVSGWVKNNLLPAEKVLSIEAATGISRHDLRPDIYPRDDAHQVAA
jgi:DNA-binding transcriptional regulator YdaS (Cro superfamily)